MIKTKKRGLCIFVHSSESGFVLHHQGLPLPPVAFPGVSVSRSVSRYPGVSVRVPSLPLPFVASPEMFKNTTFFDDFGRLSYDKHSKRITAVLSRRLLQNFVCVLCFFFLDLKHPELERVFSCRRFPSKSRRGKSYP